MQYFSNSDMVTFKSQLSTIVDFSKPITKLGHLVGTAVNDNQFKIWTTVSGSDLSLFYPVLYCSVFPARHGVSVELDWSLSLTGKLICLFLVLMGAFFTGTAILGNDSATFRGILVGILGPQLFLIPGLFTYNSSKKRLLRLLTEKLGLQEVSDRNF